MDSNINIFSSSLGDEKMIKIIFFPHNGKGFLKDAIHRTFKDINDDKELSRAIEELNILKGKCNLSKQKETKKLIREFNFMKKGECLDK